MSRIPPFNLRLTSGNLGFETSGSSHYFFSDQLKQQLSLHYAVETTSQILKWRVLQGKLRLNQTIQHGLLPMITRLRCTRRLKSKFQQSFMYYKNKWAYFGPLVGAWNQKDPLWLHKQEFQNYGSWLKPDQIKPMLEYKSYTKNPVESQTAYLQQRPETYRGKYERAPEHVLKHLLIYRTVHNKNVHLVRFNHAGSPPDVHKALLFRSIALYNKTKRRHGGLHNQEPAAFNTPGLSRAVVFSLFFCALIAQNKIKPYKVYNLNERSGLKNSPLNRPSTTYGYDHISKVSLIYKTAHPAIERGLMENKGTSLNLGPKDVYNAHHTDLKFCLSYGFNSCPNLNLFSFEHREFSNTAMQKAYLAKEGIRGFHSKHTPSVLNRRTWCIKKTYIPTFAYCADKSARTSRLNSQRSLNTYINLNFNIRSANSDASEQHLISDLSLRL